MDSLADRLNRQIDTWLSGRGGCVAAVLDAAGPETLARVFGGDAGPAAAHINVPLAPLQLPGELLPSLVPLSAENWLLRQRTVEIALDHSPGQGCPAVCGWIWCDMDAQALAARLGASMIRPLQGGGRYFFRYHDPRVRACLSALLGSEWLADQLQATHGWLSVSHSQFLRTESDAPACVPSARDVDPEAALRAIRRTEEINRAINVAVESGWSFSGRCYATADAALDRCERMSFAGAADRLAFMLHALTVSSQFDSHPVIARQLQEAIVAGESYVQAAERVPMDIWAEARTVAPALT